MIPSSFPEANHVFGPPPGLDDSQVNFISAYFGQVQGGNLDGHHYAVVAWKPTPQELEVLNQGGLVYLACLGGLPPHYLTVSFSDAAFQA